MKSNGVLKMHNKTFKILIFKGIKGQAEIMFDLNFTSETSLIEFIENNILNGYNLYKSSNLFFTLSHSSFWLEVSVDHILSMDTIFSTHRFKTFDECFLESVYKISNPLKETLEKVYYVVNEYDTK